MAKNNELIRLAKKAADEWRNTDAYYQAAQIIDMLVEELESNTLTQPNEGAKDKNVPTNEPLTLEQLREMDGEPVWVDDENDKKTWALLQVWGDENIDAVFPMPRGCFHAESVIGRKIYRRPPEGEEDT